MIPNVPYEKRLKSRELDNFCRLLYRSMRKNTMEEYIDKLQYVFKKTIAENMRKQGYKFRPVLRSNKYGPNLRKVDYKIDLKVIDKKMLITIEL